MAIRSNLGTGEDELATTTGGRMANVGPTVSNAATVMNPSALPRGAPRVQWAAPVTQAPQDDWRKRQSQLADMLFGQALGQGTTAAQGQLQQGTDANIRQAMALGQSQAGANPMAAYRAILENQARAQQEAANQAGMLRAQETQQAQSLLGGLLGGARGQDIGVSQFGQSLQEQQASRAQAQEQFMAQLNQRKAEAKTADERAMWDRWAGLAGAALGTGGALLQHGLAYGGAVGGYAAGGLTDSPQNDTVPAMLSPGEIVLPRSVVNDADAEAKAAAFVEAIKRRQQGLNTQYSPPMRS